MSNYLKVKKFMQTFGQEVKNTPAFPSEKITKLRVSLIEEELSELKAAIDDSSVFKRGKFSNYKTINSNIFIKQGKNKLSKIGVVISHQKINVSRKIKNFLVKKGLKKKQIVTIKY